MDDEVIFIDVETRMPVAIRSPECVQEFKRLTPPPAILTLPPQFLTEHQSWEKPLRILSVRHARFNKESVMNHRLPVGIGKMGKCCEELSASTTETVIGILFHYL